MSWVRIHDAALTHPKLTGLVTLTNPFTLWVWGLAYCQTHLTDGLIPKDAVPKLCRRAVSVLLDRKLWEPHVMGWKVHDYLDWNDSRELIQKKRTDAKERIALARERSSQNVRESSSREHLQRTSRDVLRGVVLRSDFKEEEIELRAGRLVERYGELYTAHRFGARHMQRPNLDWHDAQALCKLWDDARLEKLAILVLTTDDPFIAGTDRSFKIFAMKATWADDRLRQWEIANQVSV